MWVNKNNLFLSLLFAVVLFGQSSYAQTISTLRPLSFGTIAIKNYTSMISMTVNASGGYSTNSNTYIVEAPQRGEYLITGAPVSTSYTVTIPASIIMTGPGGGFTVDNFTTFLTNEKSFHGELCLALNIKANYDGILHKPNNKEESSGLLLLNKNSMGSDIPKYIPIYRVVSGTMNFLIKLMGHLPQVFI